jgi:hypothetical protein
MLNIAKGRRQGDPKYTVGYVSSFSVRVGDSKGSQVVIKQILLNTSGYRRVNKMMKFLEKWSIIAGGRDAWLSHGGVCIMSHMYRPRITAATSTKD